MVMVKKHADCGKMLTNGKLRTARYASKVVSTSHQGSYSQQLSHKFEPEIQRLTPARVHSYSSQANLGNSSRTSPGLLAGHYAGCKFSEPPLPSALPLPPREWVQSNRSVRVTFHSTNSVHNNVAQQLKMLLKIQA